MLGEQPMRVPVSQSMRPMGPGAISPIAELCLFSSSTTTREVLSMGSDGGKHFFGTAGNRSPSIAHMVWDIVTSVYSSPKAFRSGPSGRFHYLGIGGQRNSQAIFARREEPLRIGWMENTFRRKKHSGNGNHRARPQRNRREDITNPPRYPLKA